MKGQCPTPSLHVLTNQDLSHFGTNCLNQHYSPKSAWPPKTRDVSPPLDCPATPAHYLNSVVPVSPPKCQQGLELSGRRQRDSNPLPIPPPPRLHAKKERKKKRRRRTSHTDKRWVSMYKRSLLAPIPVIPLLACSQSRAERPEQGRRGNRPGHTQDNIYTSHQHSPRTCSLRRYIKKDRQT